MKTRLVQLLIAFALSCAAGTAASATTVSFNSTECPSCVNGSSVTNQWASFGLAVSNAYWYSDGRDTFDAMGLSVNSSTAPAVITLSTPSNGVSFDYWVIGGNRGVYEAFDDSHVSLGSFDVNATSSDILGTHSFSGSVKSLEWSGNRGFVQVSTLTANAIPEPETYALMLAGLGLLGFAVRRRNRLVV